MIEEEKSQLRKKLLKQRNEIEKDERKQIDIQIRQNVVSTDIYKNADIIMTYVSYGSEINTLGIINDAWNKNKQTAFPRCSTKTKGKMYFHFADSIMYFVKNDKGIDEPDRSCKMAGEEFLRTFKGKILCIVPGLAFNETGLRIGYGGGYYDRFISAHKYIYYIGLCRDKFLLTDIPHDEHDERVNCVVTESRIITVGDN